MKKKVVFFGSHSVALPLLRFLFANEFVELTGIISRPDRPAGRGQKLARPAVSEFADGNGIPLLNPQKPDGSTVAWIRDVGCDIILLVAYGHILRKNILEIPPLGIYNFHASILPKYRGPSPVETAIACGEKETGVSLMCIVEEMDAGDIADIEKVSIDDGDSYGEVVKNIAAACPTLLRRNLEKMCNGTLEVYKQNSADATFTRKLSKEDGLLDFSQPATSLKDRVRALRPHIGCTINYMGIPLGIGVVSVEISHSPTNSFGEIVSIGANGVKITTGNGILVIHELQKPGGKMLKIADFMNGFAMETGKIIPSHPMQRLIFDHPPWISKK
jgi:methionyl-tRNA formyltransferase